MITNIQKISKEKGADGMGKSKGSEGSINAVLYIRVSSTQQVEEGCSLETQEKILRQYCEVMDWKVEEVYKDKGVSGKRINRPSLQRMFKDIKKGKIQKVVILKLDRISRNTKDILDITEELETSNVSLVCVKDNIDTSTAAGKLMRTVLSAIAQFESDIAKERTLTVKEELARQGRFVGGCIPYGYDYNKDTREFSINEAEAEIVERIFNQYLQGATPYRIASELNAEGVPTKRGGKWQVNQVLTILNNSFYTGVLEWQGIINKESHEGIITERIFRKVQRKLSVKNAG